VTYGERLEKEARLRILQALRDEPDRRRAVAALRAHLRERWVINRGQEWVDLQLDILRELGAVKIVAVNDLRVAVLAERGREHLDGETELPGVRSPSEDA
jgi:hypothetical protein